MEEVLSQIDLEPFRRSIELSVGKACRVALFSSSGDPIGTVDAESAAQFADAMSRTRAAQQTDEVGMPTAGCFESADNGTLLWRSIDDAEDRQRGWLVAFLDSAGPESAHEKAAEVLDELGKMVGQECRLHVEMNGLVDELADRYEELTLIYSLEDTSKNIGEGRTGLRALLANFVEYFNVQLAVYITPGQDRLLHAVSPTARIEDLDLVLTEVRGNLFRFTAASRAPVLLNMDKDERRQFLFKTMPYKVLAYPLVHCTHVEGMIALLRSADDPDFTNSDRSLASVLVTQIAVLLRNQESVRQAKNFTKQVAGTMIRAVEAKDPYTAGHSERVERIAVKLARAMSLQAGELSDLFWGGLLHDVGKIAIPDLILTKPGKLTPDEFTLIKTHPERGYEILSSIEQLSQGTLEAVRSHHERVDGGGYPFGLSGCAIPLTGRVVAVADAYDAMTSSRPYRAALTHEEALVEIRTVAGTQLDAELVAVFDRMCAEDSGWLNEIRIAGRDSA